MAALYRQLRKRRPKRFISESISSSPRDLIQLMIFCTFVPLLFYQKKNQSKDKLRWFCGFLSEDKNVLQRDLDKLDH